MNNLNKWEKYCKTCGILFYVSLSREETAKFCSLKCKRAFRKPTCINGHDISIAGRDKLYKCIQCRRETDVRRKKKMRREGKAQSLKIIAKRAYEKQRNKCIKHATDWNKENPEKAALSGFKSKRKREYGISWEEYQDLIGEQDNKCAICGISGSGLTYNLCVDHDHKTNIIRGLLCKICNSMLGYAKEDISRLERGIVYLKKFQ